MMQMVVLYVRESCNLSGFEQSGAMRSELPVLSLGNSSFQSHDSSEVETQLYS
jgi:hypothetical protein